jgi:cation diffusion facilitator family transporter
MTDCCEVAEVPREQRRVLLVVFWINAVMFLAEFGAGLLAASTALLADSVDMLGDAIVYGFSLYVVSRGLVWKARASLLKGIVMAGFAVGVLAEALIKLARGGVPTAEVIGGVGVVALAANLGCLALLWRHRSDDINMRSAWLCSLNDVVGNVGVLAAAAGVSFTGSGWPDVAVGLAIAAMFGASAVRVLVDARRELVQPGGEPASRDSSA